MENKTMRWVFVVLGVLLIAALQVSSGLSQGQSPENQGNSPAEAAAYITPYISYQGRLVENGAPVTGVRQIIFKLWTDVTSGSCIWTEGPKDINVVDGLFQTALGDMTPFTTYVLGNMAQKLYLEIQVGANPALPRQRLMGAPYAFTLAPGAFSAGSVANQGIFGTLNENANGYGLLGASTSNRGVYGTSGSGHGVYAEGSGTGLNGAALMADALGSNGVAIYADAESIDTAIASINFGTGPLFKGFGNNGGEHEFIIQNNGDVAQALEANGLVKAAVEAYCGNTGSSIYRSFNTVSGNTTISDGATAGKCTIDFHFSLASRYIVAMARESVMRNVTCYESGTMLYCIRSDSSGTGSNGAIFVLVY